jgi:type I restriction enzyme S subunit
LKLSELCEFIVDSEHKTAPTQETGHPMIRTPNLGRGVFLLDGVRRVSDETYEAWTRRGKPKYGDLILAREAPVGNVAMVPEGLRPCLGQRTVLIRPKHEEVNAKYLAFLIVGDEIQSLIHGMSSGATVAHLNMKDIRNLEMPQLPPIKTQQKIASILSAYDDLIENNSRRIAILEETAQAIYREWFVNFRFPGFESVKLLESPLGQIPEGWEVATVGDFGNVITGTTPSKKMPENFGNYMPFIKTPSMHGNMFCIEVEEFLSEIGAESQKKKTLPPDTVIVNCIGALAGSVSITVSESQTNQQINAVVLNSPESREFLYFTLIGLRDTIRSHGSAGATMINLSKGKFEALPVVQPTPLVLSTFHDITCPTLDSIRNIQRRNIVLRATRDLLLPKLIAGKLAVEDLDIDLGLIAATLDGAAA